MEFNIVVYPPFFLSSEKTMSSPPSVLATPASYSPQNWLQVVRGDPNRHHIITTLWHYKQSRSLPDCQHEYIVLEVGPRVPPSPAPPPTLIKVSRTILNGTFFARLGLWGPATDTVEIQPPGTLFTDQCLHRLTWLPNHAPELHHITQCILAIHDAMPRYTLTRTSCYAFSRAIKDSIYICFDGLGGPQRSKFLTRESHFLCIPTGTTKAQVAAAGVAAGVVAGIAIAQNDDQEQGQGSSSRV